MIDFKPINIRFFFQPLQKSFELFDRQEKTKTTTERSESQLFKHVSLHLKIRQKQKKSPFLILFVASSLFNA